MINRLTKSILGVSTALLASVLMAVPAQAAEPDTDYIDLSTVQIAPDANLEGPLTAVDGEGNEYSAEIQGDQVAVDVTPMAGCASWISMTIPVGGTWHTSVLGCSLVGWDASSTHLYEWQVDPNSNGSPCMQGRGYKKVGVSWVEAYYGMGCGGSGSETITIGNVITNARVKGQSIGLSGTGLVWR